MPGAGGGPGVGASITQRIFSRRREQEANRRRQQNEIGVTSISGKRSNKVAPSLAEQSSNVTSIAELLEEERLPEPPTSWHHVVRHRCLSRGVPFANRCTWLLSAVLLVLVQFLVMNSFNSALSIKRCTQHSDCSSSGYCAGMTKLNRVRDVLSPDAFINRGVCHGCGTKPPDEEAIMDILETLCPHVSNGTTCVQSCALACLKPQYTDATTARLDSMHLSLYSDLELSCAAKCGIDCRAQLGKAEAATFSSFALGSWFDDELESKLTSDPTESKRGLIIGLGTYKAWLAIITQCTTCPASLRKGYQYMTPVEAENMKIYNMSLFDYVSLGLAAFVVALTMMREVRDMNIGAMMTLQCVERDRARKIKRERKAAASGGTSGGKSPMGANGNHDEVQEISAGVLESVV